ncbi:MAG TPA: ATP-binding cassette domain-containing protein [Geminicoccaceae bacterium]|nr:ATP-binding cassette domain-containing protein [Geminicoccaceae bacterium]
MREISPLRSIMLRLDHVAMRYGDGPEVLRDVNLALPPGDFVFLMGPTGSGKTSLLRLLGLLERPSHGTFTLLGRDVRGLERDELAALRRRIGMVFQEVRLLDHLSAFDNVALPLRINGGQDDQIGASVSELLAWLGLSAVIEAKPPGLSMGQRQLIGVARAVIVRPSLLLCDEPTGNLDGKVARRLMHMFSQLRKLGTTVVVATHSADLVARYPHPILRLDRGRLKRPVPAPMAMAAAE